MTKERFKTTRREAAEKRRCQWSGGRYVATDRSDVRNEPVCGRIW